VTNRLQFAIEVMVMRANAGFHADQHGCMLASRTSTWPFLLQYDTAPILADHVERVLTTISMPITAIALLSFCGMACSLSFAPLPASLTAVLKYGRTHPMTGLRRIVALHCAFGLACRTTRHLMHVESLRTCFALMIQREIEARFLGAMQLPSRS
jgi:hypothetical protein